MADELKLAPGTYVFSSDGVEIGEILEVAPHSIVVSRRSGSPVQVSMNDVDALNAGRLELRLKATDVNKSAPAPTGVGGNR